MGIQTQQDKRRFSKLRQRLRRIVEEISRVVEPFMSDLPVIRGTVYELKRKCGRKNCACARGKLHVSTAFSFTEEGRKRLRLVSEDEVMELRGKTDRARVLRQARSRLVKLHKEMLSVMDEMEAMRREEPR